MKAIITTLLFIFTLSLAQAQLDTLQHDGQERYFLVHLPPSYNGQPLPLIIAMHGGLGSATNIEKQSKLSEKADKADYIVVYPEGAKSPLGIRTWNAGVCCGYAADNDIDDVGFISALIDLMIAEYKIDSTRVYATGMSNGGFMSYRLACELTDKIAAIAPVAASMTMDNCTPSRPISVMHFHSTEDNSILYEGGVGDGLSKHYNPPLDSVLSAFAGHAKCASKGTIKTESPYSHYVWNSCSCNVAMEYFLTTDGGHSWPMGTKTAIGDTVSTQVDASDSMIQFFNQHSLACKPLSVHNPRLKRHAIYPNPTSNIIYIEDANDLRQIRLFDAQGKHIKSFGPKIQAKIDLSEFQTGLYFLEINGQERHTIQVVR